jgi:hypothetical protein
MYEGTFLEKCFILSGAVMGGAFGAVIGYLIGNLSIFETPSLSQRLSMGLLGVMPGAAAGAGTAAIAIALWYAVVFGLEVLGHLLVGSIRLAAGFVRNRFR